MNANESPVIFPQLVINQSRTGKSATRFRGIALPDDADARAAFYRGLVCVGWAAREICRRLPMVNHDRAVSSALATLREHADQLAACPAESLEQKAREAVQNRLAYLFRQEDWIATPPDFSNETPAAVMGLTDERPVVLVAEDDPVSRFLICTSLRKAGYDPRPVENGAEALLEVANYRPALILLDLNMQYVDGLQTCKWLKQSQLAGKSPVVFLSGEDDQTTIARVLEAGAADYILKPFVPEAALKRIKHQLELQSLSSSREVPAEPALFGFPQERIVTSDADRLVLERETRISAEAATDLNVMELRPARHDLAVLLRMVSWIFEPIAARQGIKLQVEAPTAGLTAVCDEVRLQRVLECLMASALKMSPPRTSITLGARADGERIVLWVQDEGPAIPPMAQAHVFDDNDASEFATCRQIVRAHGGSIETRNLPNGGVNFEFAVPSKLTSRVATRMTTQTPHPENVVAFNIESRNAKADASLLDSLFATKEPWSRNVVKFQPEPGADPSEASLLESLFA